MGILKHKVRKIVRSAPLFCANVIVSFKKAVKLFLCKFHRDVEGVSDSA